MENDNWPIRESILKLDLEIFLKNIKRKTKDNPATKLETEISLAIATYKIKDIENNIRKAARL